MITRFAQWLLLIGLLCVPAAAVAAERGLVVETSVGYVHGPGMSNPVIVNRSIDGIEDGQRARLGLRWEADSGWYAGASIARSRYVYESPLDPLCPKTAGWFVRPRYLCQIVFSPRDGQIDDKHDQLEFRLGLTRPLRSWLAAFGEIGYGNTRWISRDDREAQLTADCLSFFPPLIPVAFRHPNCRVVRSHARADGFVAKAGLTLGPFRRLSFEVAANYQGFRYSVWRNDLYPRFGAANQVSVESVVDAQRDGSWSWASVQARYALSPRWSLLLNLEGGGNRDWETVDLGVRVRL